MTLVIMAHNDRTARALALKADTNAKSIVFDPDPYGPKNALRVARLAWQVAAREGDWACVLQDDAKPCPGFVDRIIDYLWRDAQDAVGRPCAVAFYYGAQSRTGQRISENRTKTGFVDRPEGEYLATVATVVPAAWVKGWYIWSRTPMWVESTRDDECWGAYLDFMDYTAVATVPCFVDHDNTIPSVAGNDMHGPRSAAVPPPLEEPEWFTSR